MPRPLYPVSLAARHQLSSNTVQLDFRVEGEFCYQAGQFIQLHFQHQGQNFKRSYSIANTPESFYSHGILEVALSYVEGGVASEYFSQVTTGECMTIGGPFGVLTPPENPAGQLIMVGTGTGISPYRAMMAELTAIADAGTRVTVLMGARSRAELIYEADFRQLASEHSNINYTVCFSREDPVNPNKGEIQGYVQSRFQYLGINPEIDLFYLCGNPKMIDDAALLLKEAGLATKQVKREKYVYSS